jgi:hypothetical protein
MKKSSTMTRLVIKTTAGLTRAYTSMICCSSVRSVLATGETSGAGVRVAGTAVGRNGLAVGVGCTCAKKLHPRIMPRAKDATARNAILRYALVMVCTSFAVC